MLSKVNVAIIKKISTELSLLNLNFLNESVRTTELNYLYIMKFIEDGSSKFPHSSPSRLNCVFGSVANKLNALNYIIAIFGFGNELGRSNLWRKNEIKTYSARRDTIVIVIVCKIPDIRRCFIELHLFLS